MSEHADWLVTWTATFGPLSVKQQDAILAYVSFKVKNFKIEELNVAIEAIVEGWDSKNRGHPSVKMIVDNIYKRRHVQAGYNPEEPYAYIELKRKLNKLPTDTLDRWEVICEAARITSDNKWGWAMEKEANRTGGFMLPWFVNPDKHVYATSQEEPPPDARNWNDVLGQFAVMTPKEKLQFLAGKRGK